ncbi:hypothetical protein [Helicobacter felis]|uniref:hypothetical protein n=1 Tax=Helicobacter felis TaxID=214 RepID=UPI0013152E9B|nr:hypothetical protein [Helicobacter felis]
MLTEQVETNFKPKQTQVVEPIKSELTTFYDKTFDPLYYQAFSSDTPISINGINTQLQNMSNALANLGESSLQQLLMSFMAWVWMDFIIFWSGELTLKGSF